MLKRIMAVLAIVAGVAIATPATAQAGEACDSVGICGNIRLSSLSSQSLRITYNFADPWSADTWLTPGEASINGKDADGFQVQSGTWVRCEVRVFLPGTVTGGYSYTDTYGSWNGDKPLGWHQIHDNEDAVCRVYWA